MRKILIHSALLFLMLYSQLYNSFVTAVYQLNYDYYAEELCENKDKPELHCDGKCYFSKQLALQEETPKETEPPMLLPVIKLFPAPLIVELNAGCCPENYQAFTSFDMTLPESIQLKGIDHPPQV